MRVCQTIFAKSPDPPSKLRKRAKEMQIRKEKVQGLGLGQELGLRAPPEP